MLQVNNNVETLKTILESLVKHFEKPASINIPEISVTSALGHQATQTVQNFEDSQKSVATVIVTPTFVCNAVKINKIKSDAQICTASHLEVAESSLVSTTPFSSESEIPYTTDNTKDDESRKITRNSSNGSKRRTRVRRLGSRQNSKTESDSEEEQTSITQDTPRKLKRKTSKCKKTSESEKAPENQIHKTDEVVYVFKIKPGEKNELVTSKQDLTQQKLDENILISPTETCVQLIDPANENNSITHPNLTNLIVKTKRKIFSPVDEPNDGILTTVVGQDLESSSASDKNDNSEKLQDETVQNMNVGANLPPIPQSPRFYRKTDPNKGSNKELSPNIRIMIQKYNKKLTNENNTNSPHSSGSCSPIAWRSPVLDRRVRKQTEQYQEKVEQQKENFNISKSSSESKITEQIYINKSDNLVLTKVNSVDEATQTSEAQDDSLLDFGIDNSIDKSSAETVVLKDSIEIAIALDNSTERRKSLEEKINVLASAEAPAVVVQQENVPQTPSTTSTPAISYTNVKDFSWSEYSYEDSPSLSLVNMRYDENKPRTPLSERALKIKQAKEAFLRMPLSTSEGSNEIKWSYRMSQLSTGSADSSSFDDVSAISKSPLEESLAPQEVNVDTDSSSPANRNTTSASSESTETVGAIPKSNRFGLSSIATKLRKVKLMKSNKDIPKLNTVQQLCRQSLAFDITSASVPLMEDIIYAERTLSSENVPKSSSSHGIAIASRFKKSDKNEKIKKSKSMGGLPESSEDKR